MLSDSHHLSQGPSGTRGEDVRWDESGHGYSPRFIIYSYMNYVVSALTRMSVACIRKNRNTKRKEDSSWESTSMFRILKCERMSKCNARHAIDR